MCSFTLYVCVLKQWIVINEHLWLGLQTRPTLQVFTVELFRHTPYYLQLSCHANQLKEPPSVFLLLLLEVCFAEYQSLGAILFCMRRIQIPLSVTEKIKISTESCDTLA